MSKNHLTKQEIFTSRVLTLFFTCLLAGGLMWVERMAHYHMSYIFRRYTPTVLPILGGLILLGFLYLCIRYHKLKTTPQEPRVFQRGFTLYLAAVLLITVTLPSIALFGKQLQLFSMATELCGCLLLAYFIAYLFYEKGSPSAAGLCYMTCFAIIGFLYFARTYYSATSAILAGHDLMALSDWGCALIITLLLGGLYLGWLLLIKKNPAFAADPKIPLIPILLAIGAMITLCIHPLTILARTALFWSILGLQILSSILCIFLKKKK